MFKKEDVRIDGKYDKTNSELPFCYSIYIKDNLVWKDNFDTRISERLVLDYFMQDLGSLKEHLSSDNTKPLINEDECDYPEK